MEVFSNKKELIKLLAKHKSQNKSIGFVPTMGALHEGHLSLVRKAAKKNDIVVVSIFINPTQFNNPNDLDTYPKSVEKDLSLLSKEKCDIVFTPTANEIYDNNIVSEKFDFDGLESMMEGEFREGHFNGVATVIKKLFKAVEPDHAYFGKKDFQQLQIIKKLIAKYKFKVKIIGCPIFREKDGLAMSSRNLKLSKKHRDEASFIFKILKEVKKKFKNEDLNKINSWVSKKFAEQDSLSLEYFNIAEEETLQNVKTKEANKKYRAFIAVNAGEIRLIDNIRLKN